MAYKDKDKQRAKQDRLDFINSLPLPIDRIVAEPIELIESQPKVNVPYVYKPTLGYIYIVQCVGFPYYKIGHTTQNPKARIDALQTGSPFEMKLEYALEVKDITEVERVIHKCFDDMRIRGEWFVLTDKSLEKVKSKLTSLREHFLGQPIPVL